MDNSLLQRTGRQALAWRLVALRCALMVSIAACGIGGPPVPVTPTRSREVLTRDEISSSTAGQGDLYSAVQSLRPRFLATPPGVVNSGSTASSPVAVFIGRLRQSGVDALRSISANKVAEVRYLEPTASQSIYGPMASGGAIVITLLKPDDPDGPDGPRREGGR